MDFKELQQRWTPINVQYVLSKLEQGETDASPFGKTDAGNIDLRGLPCDKPIILREAKLTALDLSYSTLMKLLLINCEIVGCKFDSAELVLLSNSSKIDLTSFEDAKLSTSGSIGDAKFSNCSFAKVDLRGAIFKEGAFYSCDFKQAKLNNIEFGLSILRECQFSGTIKKTFFRGRIERCNLRNVNFVDCAFYGVKFSECVMPSDCLLFSNWARTLETLKLEFKENQLSEKGKEARDTLIDIWSELDDAIQEQIVCANDLRRMFGAVVGTEVFNWLGLQHVREQ